MPKDYDFCETRLKELNIFKMRNTQKNPGAKLMKIISSFQPYHNE